MGSVIISHSHEVGGVPFPWTGNFLVFAFPTSGKKVSKVPINIFRGRENILHDFV